MSTSAVTSFTQGPAQALAKIDAVLNASGKDAMRAPDRLVRSSGAGISGQCRAPHQLARGHSRPVRKLRIAYLMRR